MKSNEMSGRVALVRQWKKKGSNGREIKVEIIKRGRSPGDDGGETEGWTHVWVRSIVRMVKAY
jgi:hypothetical protein